MISTAVLALAVAACAPAAAPSRPTADPPAPAAASSPAADPPAQIVVRRAPDIRPEGLDYDPTSRRFFVSSTSQGTVYAVDEDGTTTPFVQDAELRSTFGLEVDAARGRLLVANSDANLLLDPDARGRASLGIYDLRTGQRSSMVDLTALSPNGRPFANDLAVDPDGNVYVSDSFAPVIYKVDPQGNASVLVTDPRLDPGPVPFLDGVDFGLGGIAYQDGSLLVAQDATSKLFTIPLDDPTSLFEATVNVPFYADGLIADRQGRLVAVGNSKISTFASDDGWRTATETLVAPGYDPSTSVAARGDDIYVLFAYFGHEESRESYEIVPVRFGQ